MIKDGWCNKQLVKCDGLFKNSKWSSYFQPHPPFLHHNCLISSSWFEASAASFGTFDIWVQCLQLLWQYFGAGWGRGGGAHHHHMPHPILSPSNSFKAFAKHQLTQKSEKFSPVFVRLTTLKSKKKNETSSALFESITALRLQYIFYHHHHHWSSLLLCR